MAYGRARDRSPVLSAAMKQAPSRLQVAALMAAAAFGLHEARYLIGSSAGAHLGPSHDYFGLLLPLLGAVCTLSLALFIRRVSLRRDCSRRITTQRTWVLATVSLLAVYVGQEALESLSASRPGGLADVIFGNAGWVALPLAAAFGALVAFVLRGAQAIVAIAARRTGVSPRRGKSARLLPRTDRAPSQAPLRHLAARGPPRLCAVL